MWADELAIDNVDFENESTYTSGWTFPNGNITTYQNLYDTSDAESGHYIELINNRNGANRTGYFTFSDSRLTSADKWRLEFDFGLASESAATGNSQNMRITCASGDVLTVTNNCNSTSASVTSEKSPSSAICTLTVPKVSSNAVNRYSAVPAFHFVIECKSDGVYATITSLDKKTSHLAETKIADATTLSKINFSTDKYYSNQSFDNIQTWAIYDEALANYTIKYVATISDAETEIKSEVVREGVVDATVTLEGSDENTITYGDHQYYYVSDNASSSTINNDNSTVVKVVFAQATFDNGAYYFKNKANGAYFAGGNNWSTHAITNSIGHVVSLSVQPGGSYHLDTQISNGGDNHYLNGVWTDGAAQGWTIASDGAGYYTINNGSGNLTAGAVGGDLTVGASTDDAAKWTVMTAAEWKDENVARLVAATASNGVDATFYIPAANFNRNDNTENAKWQGSPTLNGLNTNYNAEKQNTNFDVYQTLTGLKPGAYKLTMQGFYRNGDAADADATVRNAILYANSTEIALVNVVSEGKAEADADHGFTTLKSGKYVPDGQEDASKTFDNNYYNNELFFVVDEDGALRVGVKKSTAVTNDWTVFDNFQLTYYGNSVSATIGTYGWATFSSAYALDFSKATEGMEAYMITGHSGDVVTKSQVTGTVPAGTGLLLKGAAGNYTIPVVGSSDTDVSANLMVAGTGAAVDAGSGVTRYVLGVNNNSTPDDDSDDFAEFQKIVGTPATVAAGKAYLQFNEVISGARALRMSFGDETAVESVKAAAETAKKNGAYLENGKIAIYKNGVKFNVAGQQMK